MPSCGCLSLAVLFQFRPNKRKFQNFKLVKKLFNYLDESDNFTNEYIIESICNGCLAPFSINLKRDNASTETNTLELKTQSIGVVDETPTSNSFLIQAELVSRFKAIRDWNKCLVSSGLMAIIDPPLPNINLCSQYNQGTVRIGSWNLARFGPSKAEHPGFMEVLCITIMRTGFSLLLLQEILDPAVGDMICQELNNPTLPHMKLWCHKHPSLLPPNWKAAYSIHPTGAMYRGKEYVIFLYNSSAGININQIRLLENACASQGRSNKAFTRSPCAALCRLRTHIVVLISVHLKASGLRNADIERTISEVENLGLLAQAFYETQPAGTHLIVAGDFNLNSSHEAYSVLHKQNLCPVFKGKNSNLNNPNILRGDGVNEYDNAWLSKDLVFDLKIDPINSVHWTGDAGVITQGLRHPLIPEDIGAGANGSISDHPPIWFDIYVP